MNMLGWGNAVTILPELMYWQFGDEKALPQQYESMKKFVEAEIRKMEGRNLWLGVSLGDWLALGKDMAWQAQHNNPISNSFIVHDLKVVSETAKALGYEEDAARYQAQYQATQRCLPSNVCKEDGDVADDYQSAYIMALKFVIPEGELRQKVMKKFVENVRREGLTTGFLLRSICFLCWWRLERRSLLMMFCFRKDVRGGCTRLTGGYHYMGAVGCYP